MNLDKEEHTLRSADGGRIVVVGAGPAGLSTARAYRAAGGKGPVTLVGSEPRLPYERPPLTKDFLRGETRLEELTIEQRDWFGAQEIELQLGQRVTAIDATHGVVTLADAQRLDADAIVLATGSEPVVPDLPGADHPRVMTMREIPDSEAIAERSAEGRVLVIGSGFIGCEVAASLALKGVETIVISQERLPQVARLGIDAGKKIAGWLSSLGVQFVGDAVVGAVHDGRVVELEDGRRFAGSAVVVGAGAEPRGELAAEAGLAMHEGAVVVDHSMRTSSSACPVYAVGDIAYAFNPAAGRHLRVEHWGDALAHGVVAGQALAGANGAWEQVPGFWSTIGTQALKYAAWGDGHEAERLFDYPDGAFTIWYLRAGKTVGVLTHERDGDYELGLSLIAEGGSPP
jgi:NADPH-dependent 2,4-dienoyl-CoA reductase/sulfur reductase-like enzyme